MVLALGSHPLAGLWSLARPWKNDPKSPVLGRWCCCHFNNLQLDLGRTTIWERCRTWRKVVQPLVSLRISMPFTANGLNLGRLVPWIWSTEWFLQHHPGVFGWSVRSVMSAHLACEITGVCLSVWKFQSCPMPCLKPIHVWAAVRTNQQSNLSKTSRGLSCGRFKSELWFL